MLEFEFNTPVDTPILVEFFARCGWTDEEAGAKLEWVLAASDDWVLCKLDGELIGFGRSCRLGPLSRVVFDVLVDSRFRGRGLRSQIVRLLSQNARGLEEVSVFLEQESAALKTSTIIGDRSVMDKVPLALTDTYLGKHEAPAAGRE